MTVTNELRKHQALGYKTPANIYAASRTLWICAQHKGVAYIPTGPTSEKDSLYDQKRVDRVQLALAA
jgi:hypothetical protein